MGARFSAVSSRGLRRSIARTGFSCRISRDGFSGVTVALGEDAGVAVAFGVNCGGAVGVGVAEGDGFGVGVGVGFGVGVDFGVGVGVGLGVGVGVGAGFGVAVGFGVAFGFGVGVARGGAEEDGIRNVGAGASWAKIIPLHAKANVTRERNLAPLFISGAKTRALAAS